MTPLTALLMLAAPAVACALALLATGVLARRSPRAVGDTPPKPGLLGRIVPPAAMALAFWPADIGLTQWHDLWPRDGTKRFLAITLAAGLVGMAHASADRRWLTAVLRSLLGAGAALAVLTPLSTTYMPRWLLVALTVGAGAWLAGAGDALDRLERKGPRVASPVVLIAVAAAMAPGLFESGYAGGAQLAGSLAALGAGLGVGIALPLRRARAASGATTVGLAILASILLVTYGYQPVPAWWALVVMALAPLGALVVSLPRGRLARLGLAVLVPGVIAGAATAMVLMAVHAGEDDPDPHADWE